ncbi:LEA type 2 family protein [Proteobacteria bacterium 005FR1]|nr:LEA type 2 family protein [Proteobacteria bacterium 005FR1]
MLSSISSRFVLRFLIVVSIVALQACAVFRPGFEKPEVKIDSLQLLPSEGLSQRFRIGLLLSNPNSIALPIAGMTYTVSLNGYRVITGLAGDVPALPPYTETSVMVEGSADLVSVLRLMNSMIGKPQETLDYELLAKIDLLGARPTLRVRESGKIELLEPRAEKP